MSTETNLQEAKPDSKKYRLVVKSAEEAVRLIKENCDHAKLFRLGKLEERD